MPREWQVRGDSEGVGWGDGGGRVREAGPRGPEGVYSESFSAGMGEAGARWAGEFPGRASRERGVRSGVLVVAESAEVAAAVVGRVVPALAGGGLEVLVATGAAVDLGEVLSAARRMEAGSGPLGGLHWGRGGGGGNWGIGGSAEARASQGAGSVGPVHGLTVDLSRKEEVERVFRWVDGTLAHLDALIAVVEEVVPNWPQGDLQKWHAILDRHWVNPLLLVEGAAIRMRSRRRGHILQVALTVGSGAGRSRSEHGPWGGMEEEPIWSTLREMLELRRADLRRSGIGLTVLEVEGEWRKGGACAMGSGCALGSAVAPASVGSEKEPPEPGSAFVGALGPPGGGVVGVTNLEDGPRCPSAQDVAEAVDFCLRAEGRISVESMRLRSPCSHV